MFAFCLRTANSTLCCSAWGVYQALLKKSLSLHQKLILKNMLGYKESIKENVLLFDNHKVATSV